jgi:hypothetical protein
LLALFQINDVRPCVASEVGDAVPLKQPTDLHKAKSEGQAEVDGTAAPMAGGGVEELLTRDHKLNLTPVWLRHIDPPRRRVLDRHKVPINDEVRDHGSLNEPIKDIKDRHLPEVGKVRFIDPAE